MDIRMPRGHQRYPQLPCEVGTKHPQLARPCNVNHIGTKSLQRVSDCLLMPPEDRIELQVLLHPYRATAPLQLQRPQLPDLFERLRPDARPHTQKRQLMPFCICHKVAARMRDTVYFMGGVRKVGNTRHTHRSRLTFDQPLRNTNRRPTLIAQELKAAQASSASLRYRSMPF